MTSPSPFRPWMLPNRPYEHVLVLAWDDRRYPTRDQSRWRVLYDPELHVREAARARRQVSLPTSGARTCRSTTPRCSRRRRRSEIASSSGRRLQGNLSNAARSNPGPVCRSRRSTPSVNRRRGTGPQAQELVRSSRHHQSDHEGAASEGFPTPDLRTRTVLPSQTGREGPAGYGGKSTDPRDAQLASRST